MKILTPNSKEYKNLKAVASMLEATSINGWEYELKDIYFDYGAGIVWTTICCPTCQVLSPKEWEEIVSAETVEEFANIVNGIKADKYFQDRVKK